MPDSTADFGSKGLGVEFRPQSPAPASDIHGAVRQSPGKQRLVCGVVDRQCRIGFVYRLDKPAERGQRGPTKCVALRAADLARQRPEHQVVLGLVARRESHILLDHFLKLPASRLRSAKSLQLHPRQGVEAVPGHGCQKGVLVGEMMVRRGRGDAGPSRHSAQRDVIGSGLGDKFECGSDQSLAEISVMLPDCASHTQRLTAFNTESQDEHCSTTQDGMPMLSHATARFTADGRDLAVHAMLCGMVTVKRSHAVCCLPERTPAPLRFLTILADRRFAEPMPIWCYAVEHSEGLFVIDAGAEPSYNDDDSWAPDPRTGAVIRSFIRLNVRDGETLPARLVSAGLAPADVRAVVLTHQHIDHTGTVPAFPSAEIWTTEAEDAAANRIGALHWRWRDTATTIRYVDRDGEAGDLGATVNLTDDGRLTVIHTPGHTPGSVTVRLRTDQADIWFTGDTSFTAAGMNPDAPTAGIHSDMRQVRRLQAHLRYAGILLPAHDPGIPDRLRAAGIADGAC